MDLTQFARKYIWWQQPESSIEPRRVIGQVMNLGTFEDVVALRRLVGDEISFFGGLQFGRLNDPKTTDDSVLEGLVTATAHVSAIPSVAIASKTPSTAA